MGVRGESFAVDKEIRVKIAGHWSGKVKKDGSKNLSKISKISKIVLSKVILVRTVGRKTD